MEEDIIFLIEKIKKGDDHSFSKLAEKYNPLIDASVNKFLPSFQNGVSDTSYEIDDLKQYASLALFKAAETYDPSKSKKGRGVSFGLYAKICVNNSLISLLRKYKSSLAKSRKIGRTTSSKQSEPIDLVVQGEDAHRLRAEILDILSDYEINVFNLYIDGKSTKDIANTLNKTSKSVDNALFRIRVKIRGLMKN